MVVFNYEGFTYSSKTYQKISELSDYHPTSLLYRRSFWEN
ncbi:hypothetical protein GXM_05372 [Nostoc sphaeroides CCNUC1]|uniref:Uncharacterized protein n=1 Tax=Nostoc sphaeroides CCNUC1 TaxID=2653204 RepID=A0A5P8W5E9_9NOSO|nr:hypothetical protein GXM_05372 [Nostoc sphaeroides CCNUC1]